MFKIPLYYHTVHFGKTNFSVVQKLSDLYQVALTYPSRIAQSVVIGQHIHSVAIG
jgi:hypothetical protein